MTQSSALAMRLKVINVCLGVAVAACLVPQHWSSVSALSGYVVVLCGIVAGIAYFLNPVANTDQSSTQELRQEKFPAASPIEASGVVMVRGFEPANPDFALNMALAARSGVNTIRGLEPTGWVVIGSDVTDLPGVYPRDSRQAMATIGKTALRHPSGNRVYLIEANKVRTKLPRSGSRVLQSVAPKPRTRVYH